MTELLDARLERMRRAREEISRAKRKQVLRDLTRLYPKCKCPLRVDMARSELISLGAGCQTRYVCPCLDRYRREFGI